MEENKQTKFSVIIPTMLKCIDITRELIKNLEEEDAVGEIIIIDNSKVLDITPLLGKITPKQVRVKYYENIYVNPSWNAGVKISRYDNIAILNDDILLPKNTLEILSWFDLNEVGVIGAYEPEIVELKDYTVDTIEGVNIAPVYTRWNGFGVCMIMHKSNYVYIPEEIKIWCGDDIIFHTNLKNGKVNGMMNIKIKTRMSATSNDKIFDEIKNNDLAIYEKYYKNNLK